MAPDKFLAQGIIISWIDQYPNHLHNNTILTRRAQVHHTSGTNKALLGPVAFCIAMRISSSVTSSQGSTPYKRHILDLNDNGYDECYDVA